MLYKFKVFAVVWMRYQFFWDMALLQYLVPDGSIQHNILSFRVEDGTIMPSCNINNQIHCDTFWSIYV